MKKFFAMAMLAALLLPDAAWASYSCFGTNRPCDLNQGIRVGHTGDTTTKAAAKKPAKKKTAKKATKKHSKKKKPAAKVYCEPAPRAAKGKKVKKQHTEQTHAVPVSDLPPVVTHDSSAASASSTLPVIETPAMPEATAAPQ